MNTIQVEVAKKDPEQPKKEDPAKEVVKAIPKKVGGTSSGGSGSNNGNITKMSQLVQHIINKKTGMKVVKPSFTQLPHIPSGSFVVDNLIGGSRAGDGKGAVCPGFPKRRITEMYGPEGCGKTTMALSAVVQCQKRGGVVAYLDYEHALVDSYARKLGVKYDDSFMLYKPATLEEGIEAVQILVKAGVDLIVIDSVASMMSKDEYEKSSEDAERVGSLAAPLTRFLKKLAIWLGEGPQALKGIEQTEGTAVIFINQTRAKISMGYGGGHGGDEDQTPGGKALKFYSSLRLRLTRVKSEIVTKKGKNGGKDQKLPYGNVTSVKVVKTRLDLKQGHDGLVFIRYGYGLDNVYSIIETAVTLGLAKRDGAYFTYNGNRVQGRETLRKYLLENPKVQEELQTKILDKLATMGTDSEEDSDEDEVMLESLAGNVSDDAAYNLNEDAETESDVSADNDGEETAELT